ncbi:TlpA family protein disulfide reductase [Candidatus Sumerlaeota bacterium]|nr:TlpA family protein disulfide reductase [Candidatus Sumerlaeota bacterium]
MLQSGSDAYPFILNDIDGDPMMIEGNAPPTLLIFFEADCQTCQLTFSYLNRLFEMIAPNGGRIFGISQDARRETRTFIEQTGCKFPILFDQGLKVSREYDPEAVPAVFLLDRNFKVSRTMIGFNKAHLNAAAKEMMLTLGMSYDILALDFDGNPNYKSGSMPRHRESETLIEGPAWPDLSVRGGGEDAGVESPIEVLPAVSVPGPAPSAAGTHVHIEESVKLPSIAIIDPGIEVRELETNGEHAGFAASRVLVHEEHDPQEFCAERGYGDGLPVIPPTLARVEKFLARTDVPPEEIIARISPARSAATVEKDCCQWSDGGLCSGDDEASDRFDPRGRGREVCAISPAMPLSVFVAPDHSEWPCSG